VNEDDRLRAEAALQSARLFHTEVERRLAIGTKEALADCERLLNSARTALDMAAGWIKVLQGEEVAVDVGPKEANPEG